MSRKGFIKTKPEAWDEIYARLDAWKRYHAGVCITPDCGSIRYQGMDICLECWEALEEQEHKEHLMEMSL